MKQVQKPKKPIIFYYVIALIVILLLNLLLFPRLLEPKVTEVDYGKFLQMVDNNEISEVQIQSNEIIFSDKSSPANYYKTGVMNDYKLVDRLYEAGITEFGTPIIEQMSPLMEFLLTWVIPIVVMVALGQWLMKRMTSKMMGGMGNAMSFGKSNAKVYVQSETGIKFADVAGEHEPAIFVEFPINAAARNHAGGIGGLSAFRFRLFQQRCCHRHSYFFRFWQGFFCVFRL